MRHVTSIALAALLAAPLVGAQVISGPPDQMAPSVVQAPLSQSIALGADVTFSVTAGGSGPFAYQWQFDGTNVPGGTIINTVAGGYVGNAVPATNACLNFPAGVAVDPSGNLFIADTDDNLIRKVDANGIITTVAGNGVAGFNGDGGAATNASLNSPNGVAVDALGNLFIADTGNNVIRKVDTTGVITTVAGGGNVQLGDGGAATDASLNSPGGVAVDSSGHLFIADTFNSRIRRVDANGIITTFAGGGTPGFSGDGGPASAAGLSGPSGVAVDTSGNVFIVDRFSGRIRKVGANGVITTVAGGGNVSLGAVGPATNADLGFPLAVAVDASGNLFISETDDGLISKVDTHGNITTVAGGKGHGSTGDGGAATAARLNDPAGVAVDALGNLFIADMANSRIRAMGGNGIIRTVAGGYIGNQVPATQASLNNPLGVAMDLSRNLFIADSVNNLVRRVDTNGIMTIVAGNRNSGYSGDGGAATLATLNSPAGVAVSSAGILFIADTGNGVIRRVGANGIITTAAGGGHNYPGDGGLATAARLNSPAGVAVDASGNLFIADTSDHLIRRVDASGVITTVAGNGNPGYSGDGGWATNASLTSPEGVTVDAFGNLFIADTGNQVVRKVDTSGNITTIAGGGIAFPGEGGAATAARLNSPYGVAVDALGNLFVSDTYDSVVRRVGLDGLITTVAGDGYFGFSGDGGPATNATLADPVGVMVDPLGDLFIADSGNNCIREVTSAPTLTLAPVSLNDAGSYDVVITSPFGSVTSCVATLTVGLSPLSVCLGPGANVTFQFHGQPGSNYILLCTPALASPILWLPIVTNAADASGNWTYTETNRAAYPRRFFRIAPPEP